MKCWAFTLIIALHEINIGRLQLIQIKNYLSKDNQFYGSFDFVNIAP